MAEKIGDDGMYEFSPEDIAALIKAQDEAKSKDIIKPIKLDVNNLKPVQPGSYNNADEIVTQEFSTEEIGFLSKLPKEENE